MRAAAAGPTTMAARVSWSSVSGGRLQEALGSPTCGRRWRLSDRGQG